jgi:2-polyprenyl-3-methyl-5-hydroxy-6-metoxy-1,4-benzoquinol methylase
MATNSQTNLFLCECCDGPTVLIRVKKRGYEFRKCLNCGTFSVCPQPSLEDLKKVYSGLVGYLARSHDEENNQISNEALFIHNKLIKHMKAMGRILDVGCSTGNTLQGLCRLGWQGSGCDINQSAVVIAKAKGLDVSLDTLETDNYSPASFSAIHMGNVLEHLLSPEATIRKTYSILEKGGLLILRIPNAESNFAVLSLWMSKVTRFPWAYSEAPYHLFEFTPAGIISLLEKSKFKILEIETSNHPSFMYIVGASGWFDELKRELKENGKYRINITILCYLPKLIFVSVLLFPVFFCSRVLDQFRKSGHIITIIGMKT